MVTASPLEHVRSYMQTGNMDLSGMGYSQHDSRESFAIETAIFIASQADSPESLDFLIRH